MVLDRKRNKKADTGRFELAYKQKLVPLPSAVGLNLTVEGQQMSRPGARSHTHVPVSRELDVSCYKTELVPRPPPHPNNIRSAPPSLKDHTPSCPAISVKGAQMIDLKKEKGNMLTVNSIPTVEFENKVCYILFQGIL